MLLKINKPNQLIIWLHLKLVILLVNIYAKNLGDFDELDNFLIIFVGWNDKYVSSINNTSLQSSPWESLCYRDEFCEQ